MSTAQATARTEWSRRLARALASAGYMDEASLVTLVDEAVASDVPLARLAIARGVAPAGVVVGTLAQLARLPAVDLTADLPAPEAGDLLPADVTRAHRVVPLRVVGSQVVLVFAEPPDASIVQALGERVGRQVVPALGDPAVVDALLGVEAAAPTPAQNGAAAHVSGTATGAPPAGAAAAAADPSAPADPGQRVRGTATGGLPAYGDPVVASGRPPLGEEMPLHLDDLLRYAVDVGASDLHLTANLPPTVRLHGALRPLDGVPPLDPNTVREMIFGVLPQSMRERFEAEHELDTSHSVADVGRFRVNVALQRGTIAVALRPIPHEIPEFASLGLPETIASFAEMRRGLVLVTGPTGSGKSTTLASIVDIINRTKPLHIVTVEDPIEFLHTHKRSVLSQREVGADTNSFAEALRRALRQDPDVILVGEMRDLETISTALTAAETGHLVFATLHTQDAPSTVDRVIDVFPPTQQEQIRIQLSSALRGVVTQQLVPTVDGGGRAVAAEVLLCTPAIQNLIRAAKTHQIYSLMQTGGQYGMQTMDQCLATLVRQHRVTEAMALDRCRNEDDFRNHLHGR